MLLNQHSITYCHHCSSFSTLKLKKCIYQNSCHYRQCVNVHIWICAFFEIFENIWKFSVVKDLQSNQKCLSVELIWRRLYRQIDIARDRVWIEIVSNLFTSKTLSKRWSARFRLLSFFTILYRQIDIRCCYHSSPFYIDK